MKRTRAWWVAVLVVTVGLLWVRGPPLKETYVDDTKKKRRVCIVMFSTPNIVEQYAGLAAQVNEGYARRHGYAFRHVIEDVDPPTDRAAMVWKMVDVIGDALETGLYDAVFYIDSDAVFQQRDKRLDWLFEILDGHIVGCSDAPNGPSYINTGTLFVRNTPRARDLLAKWRAMRAEARYRETFPYEQQALHDLAAREKKGIVALPAEEFNSIKARVDKGHRDTFVLHMMAAPADVRAAEFRRILSF